MKKGSILIISKRSQNAMLRYAMLHPRLALQAHPLAEERGKPYLQGTVFPWVSKKKKPLVLSRQFWIYGTFGVRKNGVPILCGLLSTTYCLIGIFPAPNRAQLPRSIAALEFPLGQDLGYWKRRYAMGRNGLDSGLWRQKALLVFCPWRL